MSEVKYAGFWVRFLASLLDTLFLAVPIGLVIYFLSDGNWFDFSQYQKTIQAAMAGNAQYALNNSPQMSMKWELLFEFAVLIVTIVFWRKWRGATPGKKYLNIKIVDAKTLQDIDNKQAVTRSIGYIASVLIFLIGFLMIGFRKDKRGLHDLLADTVVVYDETA
jgi:uncharacterized RDD family membrane protein YckC